MPNANGPTCPECKTTMNVTHPKPQELADYLHAECPGCGFVLTPEAVRDTAQRIVDEAKEKRRVKKLGK